MLAFGFHSSCAVEKHNRQAQSDKCSASRGVGSTHCFTFKRWIISMHGKGAAVSGRVTSWKVEWYQPGYPTMHPFCKGNMTQLFQDLSRRLTGQKSQWHVCITLPFAKYFHPLYPYLSPLHTLRRRAGRAKISNFILRNGDASWASSLLQITWLIKSESQYWVLVFWTLFH